MDISQHRLRRERQRRKRVLWQLATAAAGVAATVWLLASGAMPNAARPAAAPTSSWSRSNSGIDWKSEVTRLDRCRQRLLVLRSNGGAEACFVLGSPAELAERTSIAALIAHGIELPALPLRVSSAALDSRRWSEAGEFAQLSVVDERLEFTALVSGSPIPLAARSARAWVVTLFRADPKDAWRYFEFSPAAG